jgi:hypothetical protein
MTWNASRLLSSIPRPNKYPLMRLQYVLCSNMSWPENYNVYDIRSGKTNLNTYKPGSYIVEKRMHIIKLNIIKMVSVHLSVVRHLQMKHFTVSSRRNIAETITWEEGEGGGYSGLLAGYIWQWPCSSRARQQTLGPSLSQLERQEEKPFSCPVRWPVPIPILPSLP